MVLLEVTVRDIDGRLVLRCSAQDPLRVGACVRLGRERWTVLRSSELLADGSWTQTVFVEAVRAYELASA
jgi:hypothetical protein